MARDFLYSKEDFEQYVRDVRELRTSGTLTHPLPAVTICRDAGARGEMTAHCLKNYLDAVTDPHPLWQVFEANLVDLILEKADLKNLSSVHLQEESSSIFKKMKALLQGLPSDYEIYEETVAVIKELLDLGHCIIVGRGASFVAASMANVIKIKLTVSEQTALRRIAKDEGVSRTEAASIYRNRNKARRSYIKDYYRQNPDEKRHYDEVINTDDKSAAEVAEHIGKLVIQRTKELFGEGK